MTSAALPSRSTSTRVFSGWASWTSTSRRVANKVAEPRRADVPGDGHHGQGLGRLHHLGSRVLLEGGIGTDEVERQGPTIWVQGGTDQSGP